jgi:hypothetical protein
MCADSSSFSTCQRGSKLHWSGYLVQYPPGSVGFLATST